jgi:hypothetical protein
MNHIYSLPRGYDSQFIPSFEDLPDEPCECFSCHKDIDPDFDVIVWLSVGHGLSESFHASCGADVWAESLDLPLRGDEI